MITVSDEYKRLIKEPIREIKPIVDIWASGMNVNEYINSASYSGPEAIASSEEALNICNLETVIDKNSICYKYAILDEDYFQLDGSFILPNANNNKYTGFIGDFNSSTLTIETSQQIFRDYMLNSTAERGNAKNITVYFGDNYPTDLEIKITAKMGTYGNLRDEVFTYTYTGNTSKVITTDEIPGDYYGIKKIEIKVNQSFNSSHRVIIKQVYFGTTMLLEGDEIINIKHLEQTDIYNVNMPDNNLTIEINNFDRKFDLLDNNNILNKLRTYEESYKENIDRYPETFAKLQASKIRTFLQIGTEIIELGYYYFDRYENQKDLRTTITCKGLIENLGNRNQALFYDTDRLDPTSPENLKETLSYVAGRIGTDNVETAWITDPEVEMGYSNFNNRKEQLQALCMYGGCFPLNERDFGITEEDIYPRLKIVKATQPVRRLFSLKDQIGYPKIVKNINKTKDVVFKNISLGEKNNNLEVILDDTFKSNENGMIEVSLAELNVPVEEASLEVYLNGTLISNYSIDYRFNYYWVYYKITGLQASQNYQIKIKAKQYSNAREIERQVYIGEKGSILEITNNLIRDISFMGTLGYYIAYLQKDYEFEIDVMGDPSLEAGDKIQYETENGWQEGYIQSIDTTYNGGLTQIIKGVSSNVLQ